jgi:protein-L-isoaspartate(D-aspartate) O-methyltransferase
MLKVSTPMLDEQAELDQMIAQQVRTWDVLDTRVLGAMQMVPREHFVPPAFASLAYADSALPLPLGKRMLTPMVAGRILQALEVMPGDAVLEVGTGSGYLSACLAALGASVQSLELHAQIAELARANLRAAGIDGVKVSCVDGAALVSEPVYDAIVLTASLPMYQPRFERALKLGGRLFVVVGTDPPMEARLLRRHGPNEFSSHSLFETSLEALEHAPAPPLFKF